MAKSRHQWLTLDLIALVCICIIFSVAGIVVFPRYLSAKPSPEKQYVITVVAPVIEMYANDTYSDTRDSSRVITSNYLKVIPTYASQGYEARYNPSCHTTINNSTDYPQYDSIQGLIEP